jgi:hypothetical protein
MMVIIVAAFIAFRIRKNANNTSSNAKLQKANITAVTTENDNSSDR